MRRWMRSPSVRTRKPRIHCHSGPFGIVPEVCCSSRCCRAVVPAFGKGPKLGRCATPTVAASAAGSGARCAWDPAGLAGRRFTPDRNRRTRYVRFSPRCHTTGQVRGAAGRRWCIRLTLSRRAARWSCSRCGPRAARRPSCGSPATGAWPSRRGGVWRCPPALAARRV